MWVVFRKSDKKVVGLGVDTPVPIEKEAAVRDVVQSLIDAGDPEEYDAVQSERQGSLADLSMAIAQGTVSVREDKSGGAQIVAEEPPGPLFLSVTTSAKDFHPVDQVPLLPGDGESFLVITLKKLDWQGKPMIRKTKDNDVIWLRSSHGTVREDKEESPREIRSVTLASGSASFRLYSDKAKRLASVQLLAADRNLQTGTLQVEFT